MKRDKDNYTIQAVSHALDLLESFTKTEDELGVTELSRRLGLHKNNIFRLLATLESRGYIEQNKLTENYRLGPKTLQISSIFIEQRECRRHARPILEKLMQTTGETAVVAVLRGDKIIYMDSAETGRTVRAVAQIGSILPAHCTAVGKVQLAYLADAELERLYPSGQLVALTSNSRTRLDALLGELKGIRERGYAIENEEVEPDVRGVAVAVKDFSNNVIAALGIIAPFGRLAEERLHSGGILMRISEAGEELSQKLGFIAPIAKKVPM